MKKSVVLIFTALILSSQLDACACGFFKKCHKTKPVQKEQSSVSPISEREQITEALDRLFDSYNSRRLSSFMKKVSEDFSEDEDLLEDSLRRDFLKYSYIDAQYFLNSIIPDDKGKYAVTINYTRKLQDRRTGIITPDSGFTTLIFIKDGERYKLYSQRRPYIFGNN
jgi:hypothetical protein